MLRACNCHHNQDIEQFCHPSPQIPMDPFAISPFPQPLAKTGLLSFPIILPFPKLE